jgi:hypothetical protein
MKVYHFPEGNGRAQYLMLLSDLLDAPVVHTGEWQTINTEKSPAHATHELEDVSLVWERLPSDVDEIIPAVDQSWVDDHFLERVSGQPLNPAPSHVNWPYAVRGNADHTKPHSSGHPRQRPNPVITESPSGTTVVQAHQFDHTYPERFWPKHAGHDHSDLGDWWTDGGKALGDNICGGSQGIRFPYGDLGDVVDLLVRNPLTRQAFLPVWFPEDTGAVDSQRVPCTLGYHFMQRGGRLSCRYYIRSCDAYRHLSNDVWLTAMLTRWVAQQVTERSGHLLHFRLGGMAMHISSLHSFVGDRVKMKDRIEAVSK